MVHLSLLHMGSIMPTPIPSGAYILLQKYYNVKNLALTSQYFYIAGSFLAFSKEITAFFARFSRFFVLFRREFPLLKHFAYAKPAIPDILMLSKLFRPVAG